VVEEEKRQKETNSHIIEGDRERQRQRQRRNKQFQRKVKGMEVSERN